MRNMGRRKMRAARTLSACLLLAALLCGAARGETAPAEEAVPVQLETGAVVYADREIVAQGIDCGQYLADLPDGARVRLDGGFLYTAGEDQYGPFIDRAAYVGEYVPRILPDEIGGIGYYMTYDDPMFEGFIEESGLYRYARVSGSEAYITGYTGETEIAYIPEEIDGLAVTGIGKAAFDYSGYETEKFADVVVVPGTVKYIGREAFACTGIKLIILHEGVEFIDDYAFRAYSQLDMELPASVKRMGANPFVTDVDHAYVHGYLFPYVYGNDYFATDYDSIYGLEDMRLVTYNYRSEKTSYSIPEGIEVIGDSAFYEASALEKVTLPGSVRGIGKMAFFYCCSLAEAELNEGLETIGDWAFSDCDIRNITIPDSVAFIGDYAFYGCPMESITIPAGVTEIGEPLFTESVGQTVTVICEKGSAAEAYAEAHGYRTAYIE